MELKQFNQENLFNDILKQLAIAVAERNYEPRNIQDQQHNRNKSHKRFVKASKRNRFRIGMFRTTKPYHSGIEEIIAEDAVIVHEKRKLFQIMKKQNIQCHMKELQNLKQAIEEIEKTSCLNNILQGIFHQS